MQSVNDFRLPKSVLNMKRLYSVTLESTNLIGTLTPSETGASALNEQHNTLNEQHNTINTFSQPNNRSNCATQALNNTYATSENSMKSGSKRFVSGSTTIPRHNILYHHSDQRYTALPRSHIFNRVSASFNLQCHFLHAAIMFLML
jgi:hypothetical protein